MKLSKIEISTPTSRKVTARLFMAVWHTSFPIRQGVNPAPLRSAPGGCLRQIPVPGHLHELTATLTGECHANFKNKLQRRCPPQAPPCRNRLPAIADLDAHPPIDRGTEQAAPGNRPQGQAARPVRGGNSDHSQIRDSVPGSTAPYRAYS